MSEDSPSTPDTSGEEPKPSSAAETRAPEATTSMPEVVKRKLTRLGNAVLKAVDLYGYYTTGGLFSALPRQPKQNSDEMQGAASSRQPNAESQPPLDNPTELNQESQSNNPQGAEEENGTENDSFEETIQEDTDESLAQGSEVNNSVEAYLAEVGVDEEKIKAVREILDSDLSELVRRHLSNAGVEAENLEQTASLLVPHQLYLKKLHELGMPASNDDRAHKTLVEGKGRLRLKHLVDLVGGKEEELRQLMKTHHQDLLDEELKKLGFDDEKINEISATPRRDKSKLVQEALRRLDLNDQTIAGIELSSALAEVPPDIAQAANETGIPLETLVRAREAFKRADWKDTFDYLDLAKKDERVREQLRQQGIEIEPAEETNDEKATRLKNMTLKEINEKYPAEWEAERTRRVARKKEELAAMLEKYKDYLPLDELPLPDDVDVPPDEKIPDDVLGAYGLWKRLLVSSYDKRISHEGTYKGVRAELHRVGGPLPIVRKANQRILALRILKKEKARARAAGVKRNFGAFGWGYDKYKKVFRTIEDEDIKVKNALTALNVWHKQNFIADEQGTPRKNLAETIVDIKLRELAFRHGELNPIDPRTISPPEEGQESA